jgi:two-component system, OmpR family, response regulator
MPTSLPTHFETGSSSSKALVTLRVLLVEDSRVLADRLRESLDTLDNVEVVAAVTDESSAVAAAKEKKVDVIILDLQLKEGTGFGVVERLGKARPLVIVFTNYMLPEYQRLATALGIEYFLNKSLDYERLPQLIQEIGAGQRPH